MELGSYKLRNGLTGEIVSFSNAVSALDSESGAPIKLRLAWGKDSRGNHMAWREDTGQHHVGGHVQPGTKEYDIVGPA